MSKGRHTKIVCTLGPSTEDILVDMRNEGMDAARINIAHGDFDDYKRMVRQARLQGVPVILDIKGPELRMKIDKERQIRKGDRLRFGGEISLTQPCDLDDGTKVLLDDGKIEAVVEDGSLRFTSDGLLKDNKSVHVPGVHLDVEPLSEKDRKAVAFANEESIAFVALSHVRDAEDINRLRDLLDEGIQIIAKIESQEGIDNIDEIIRTSDGIMVARGDLGVDLPLWKVPMIQKDTVRRCRKEGKLVITATEMLESMIVKSRPTRAEASDVANAVLDGSDALMLSGETAIGQHPLETVRVMSSIIREIQGSLQEGLPAFHSDNISDAITASVFRLCRTTDIDKIVCITRSGHTARMMSRFRMDMQTIACTPEPMVARQLSLYYSVLPVILELPEHDRIRFVAKELLSRGMVSSDDRVVFTAGEYTREVSNMLQVHTIRDLVD